MDAKVKWTSLGTLKDGQPRGWETRVGELRITVHTHIDDPDGVFVSCYAVGLDRHQIARAPMTEEAKTVALRAVRKRVHALYTLTSGWD